MTAELFIHGPRHAFYGKRDEVAYSQLFDDSQIKDNVRFIVEIRKGSDGKWYAYYNYCRYANVLDIAGRNGAYLGVTLRLDMYYANLRNVYTILNSIFTRGVIGLLLKVIPNGFQYIVNDFEDCKNSILEKIEKPLGTLLSNVISMQEVYPIDGSFKVGGQSIFKAIDDTQYLERRLNDIKTSGKIIFSSSLPIEQIQTIIDNCEKDKQSFAESKKQYIEQLQQNLDVINSKLKDTSLELQSSKQIINNLEEKINILTSEIATFEEERKNIKNLKVINEELLKKNKILESEIASLNKKNLILKESLQDVDKFKREISRLKKDLDKSNNDLKVAESEIKKLNKRLKQEDVEIVELESVQEEVHKDSTKSKLVKYLNIVVAFFCGAITIFILGYFWGDKKDTGNATNLSGEKGEIVSKREKINIYPNSLSERIYPDLATEEVLVLSADSLFTGNEYEVTLKEHQLDSCVWTITNADKVEETAFKLKFKPTKIGTTEIIVSYDDTIIVKRLIQIN